MKHSSRRCRAIALTVAALVSVPALATTAAAVDLYAPHARAAAKVAANGTLLAEKNVASSRRVATGQYCVTVSDPDIDDLTTAAIQATSNSAFSTLIVFGQPTTTCGNAADTITVWSSDRYSSAGWTDSAFTVTVQ